MWAKSVTFTHACALAGVITAFLFAGVLSAQAHAANSLGTEMCGISTGGAIQGEDPATLDRDLDTISAVGARWIRVDINWAQIQSAGPTTYDWDRLDAVVHGATSRGLNVLGIITYTPQWARAPGADSDKAPPADPATYAAFASTAVERYAAMGVHSYEVWNEPNVSAFWAPAPNVSAYTQLLRAAYPAIKAADPSAVVLTGGLAPAVNNATSIAPADFLQGVYANGGGGQFDAVSDHPYTFPAYPGDTQDWNAWFQMTGAATSLRSVMAANGDSAKKIWATEYGAPTNGPAGGYVSEDTQAQMITKAFALWRTYDWAGPLFVYQQRDLGTATDDRENFFGLVRADFSHKPAFDAYRAAVDAVASGAPATDDPATDDPATGDPATGASSAATTVAVKGKSRGKGASTIKGRVSRRSESTGAGGRHVGGRVWVKLYRRSGGRWHQATEWKATRVGHSGRFRRSLKNLRKGIYRAQARYPGHGAVAASSDRSPRFRVRA
jgi:hypothetical protein